MLRKLLYALVQWIIDTASTISMNQAIGALVSAMQAGIPLPLSLLRLLGMDITWQEERARYTRITTTWMMKENHRWARVSTTCSRNNLSYTRTQHMGCVRSSLQETTLDIFCTSGQFSQQFCKGYLSTPCKPRLRRESTSFSSSRRSIEFQRKKYVACPP